MCGGRGVRGARIRTSRAILPAPRASLRLRFSFRSSNVAGDCAGLAPLLGMERTVASPRVRLPAYGCLSSNLQGSASSRIQAVLGAFEPPENRVHFRRIGDEEIAVHDTECPCERGQGIGFFLEFNEEPARSLERVFLVSISIDLIGVVLEVPPVQWTMSNRSTETRDHRDGIFMFPAPQAGKNVTCVVCRIDPLRSRGFDSDCTVANR